MRGTKYWDPMANESLTETLSQLKLPQFAEGMSSLLQAVKYAQDTESDHWEFAISIGYMRSIGLTENDLRWLVKKQYVHHAREVTVLGDNGREFRATGDLSFCSKTCFVLTDIGNDLASELAHESHVLGHNADLRSSKQREPALVPVWDSEVRELRFCGRIVKQFKWPAENQEHVLSAFEEDGWPKVLDDPLAPLPGTDPKRRLQDTIKALNKKQSDARLRFRGNGRGNGIVWEVVSD